MPQENDSRKEGVWHSIVVPTAIGLEAFFWRVAWFSLVVVLAYFCLFAHHAPARTDHRDVEATEPLDDQSNPRAAHVKQLPGYGALPAQPARDQ